MAAFLLTLENIEFVKEHLRGTLLAAKSAHLTEALASGLGFRTHAALLAAIKTAPTARPLLGSIDDAKIATRLVELGFPATKPVSTLDVIRSREFPDRIWAEFQSGDRDANDLWFFECRHRNIPNLRIERRRKYFKLHWDCISIHPDDEAHVQGTNGRVLVRKMYDTFQDIARTTEGKPMFQGSSFVGSVDRLSPEMARAMADAFFAMLFLPMHEQTKAA